jgi:hypothetical protein
MPPVWLLQGWMAILHDGWGMLLDGRRKLMSVWRERCRWNAGKGRTANLVWWVAGMGKRPFGATSDMPTIRPDGFANPNTQG